MLINAVCLPINDLLIWFKKKKSQTRIILLIWYVQADESDLQLIVLSMRLDIIISARIFYICHTSISNRTLAMKKNEGVLHTEKLGEFLQYLFFFLFFFFPTRAKYQEIVCAHLWNVGGSWSTWRDTRGGRGRAYSQTFGPAYWAPLRSQEWVNIKLSD